jgi:hypothetical protein
MRVDIYRRAESGHRYSYLAVPEGRVIPEEATNTDWETEARGLEGGAKAEHMDKYAIAGLEQQISEKGYAITSVRDRVDAGD